MGTCVKCGCSIGDQYKYCLPCLEKIKAGNKGVDNEDVITALGQINNNLYYLRRATAILLKDKYATEIIWDKKKKDFVEKKIKGKLEALAKRKKAA